METIKKHLQNNIPGDLQARTSRVLTKEFLVHNICKWGGETESTGFPAQGAINAARKRHSEGGCTMRRSVSVASAVLVAFFLMVSMVTAEEKGKMVTTIGNVTSVDPDGKAITISVKTSSGEMTDVGTIVNADTVIKVEGKPAALSNIKEGDVVTVRYLKSDDLYAREVTKK